MELFRGLEDEARRVLPAGVYDYYAGGAGDEQTLAENLEAWRKVWLRPRGLVDVRQVDMDVEVLGDRMAMPLLLAPMGQQGTMPPRETTRPVPARCAASAKVRAPCSSRSANEPLLAFSIEWIR